METMRSVRWILLTAVAPVAWGSVYFVTRNFLPDDDPLWGGVYRALPAGVVLLLVARRLLRGSWWWRAVLLGLLNVGGFFSLIYIAATRLPSSLAATLMSVSTAALLLLGWAVLGQRPRLASVAGAITGIVGVVVMLGVGATGVDPWGVVASLGAMAASSVGFVLTARWGRGIEPVALASWQLIAGSVLLIPVAALLEGAPRLPSGSALIGFAYITLVATALAYAAWFTGLQRLPTAAVGAVGLLNPLTGVALGVLVAGEPFGVAQAVGATLVVVGVVLGSWPVGRRGDVASAAGRTRACEVQTN